MSQQVSLEILEPRGVLSDPKREGLFAPRLSDLNGRTIALMGINIPVFHTSSEPFFEVVERRLRERYPKVNILRMNSFGTPIDPPEKAYEVAAKCDAWLEGVKDAHTQGRHDAGVCMERAGRPGVSICVDVLRRAKEAGQDLYGMPGVRIVTVPATDYNAAKDDPGLMERVVDGCIDAIIEGLTKPLTEEEKRSFDLTFDEGPKTFTGGCYSEAYEKFMEYCMTNHLGDGLALAPPTKEAVEWMLSGTSYPRDRVIGLVEPKLGKATVEKIAIAAVMAGAKPEWLPVIIAIMEVLTDPGFNQFHIVNEILPAIFVSGPIVKELGLNNKVGYLAPGTRANSAIGRAVLMAGYDHLRLPRRRGPPGGLRQHFRGGESGGKPLGILGGAERLRSGGERGHRLRISGRIRRTRRDRGLPGFRREAGGPHQDVRQEGRRLCFRPASLRRGRPPHAGDAPHPGAAAGRPGLHQAEPHPIPLRPERDRL